jgi:hypothetical protein
MYIGVYVAALWISDLRLALASSNASTPILAGKTAKDRQTDMDTDTD